ncbi:heme oxygenase-like protein [Lindgomyces ingoldianus]|uniref:Heme oxygenase-like protein n=1 Tax=Lindgomyces ingoldianus TaxID=673940 RepID=A0ACB6R728_9PLEO|nr:heme oxygenase-like protein [Lindgomyces ingoldianus]KAF2474125.1 heme oxygenase-like protein [Lindgomyces ingoldianus]
MASSTSPWSLTTHLLTLHIPQFTRVTQSPFLRLAAAGQLPKPTISHWLANDRLYMQGYIRLTGQLMLLLSLPEKSSPSNTKDTVEVRLLDWLVDALVNIRREERFFIDVAERYGLDLDLVGNGTKIAGGGKIEGLKRFEKLFGSLTTNAKPADFLPWLEGAVVFWATEKVYFEAWSWAKRQEAGQGVRKAVDGDEDGGAMRKEFIPNWTNEEFIAFVDTLEGILNDAVGDAVGGNEDLKSEVCERVEKVWKELLDAEEAFWPQV